MYSERLNTDVLSEQPLNQEIQLHTGRQNQEISFRNPDQENLIQNGDIQNKRSFKEQLKILEDQQIARGYSIHRYQEKKFQKGISKQKYLNLGIISEDKGNAFEDGRVTKSQFSDYLLIDVACSLFSFLGIILAVLNFELEFNERNPEINILICWYLFVSSILSALMCIPKYLSLMDWLKARNDISEGDGLFSSGIYKQLVFDILLMLVVPTPFTIGLRVDINADRIYLGYEELYYHVNEILGFVVMIRIYFVIRTLLMQTYYYNNRCQRVCNIFGCEGNNLFVIKCVMRSSPYTFVSLMFFGSLFWFGQLLRISEAPLSRTEDGQNFLYYGNCLWLCLITMTTVGYGDFFPKTSFGRFVIVFVSIWGVFIVSILVVTLVSTLVPSTLERKAIITLEKLKSKDELSTNSTQCIGLFKDLVTAEKKYKYFKGMQQENSLELDNSKLVFSNSYAQLKLLLKNYTKLNRQYRAMSDDNVSEEMTRQFDLQTMYVKRVEENQKEHIKINQQLLKLLNIPNPLDKYEFDVNLEEIQIAQITEDKYVTEVKNFKNNVHISPFSISRRKTKNDEYM